jgi:hypothetical protein
MQHQKQIKNYFEHIPDFNNNYETQNLKRCLHHLIPNYFTASLHDASTTALLTACKVEKDDHERGGQDKE